MRDHLNAMLAGRYSVERELGRGGMATVWLARDLRHDRPVAIKVLHPELAGAIGVDRFIREVQLTARLQHPSIVPVLDSGVLPATDNTPLPWYAMPCVTGESLRTRLSREQQLPIEEALHISEEVAGALHAAHRQGIVHRDIKPENVLLSDGRAYVVDFGIAKALIETGGERLTGTGIAIGTPAYMSPEQASGTAVDARTDQYSLATMLYEMLAGEPPFSGPTAQAIIARRFSEPARALRPVRSTVPLRIETAVLKALERVPADRFPDVAAFVTALRMPPQPVKEPPSIAVLPFANMSADPESEYFSDGLAEEIINALTRIEGLHVAARTSSFSFKGKAAEIGEIARRLNVRHVLEGSVRKAGGRVRVTAQLVDATNGYQLWSERYDRELADIFDVQDDIARSIVARLKVALDTVGAARLVRATTANMDAYQQYLKGRAMLYRRGPWIARALECFRAAVGLDPNYTQAWAGVADAYTTLCYSGFGRPNEIMPGALEAATKATFLDPASAEAHNALAVAALLWERDFNKAEREFLEALTLNPKYMQARCWYGLFFLQWGVWRLDEGLAEVLRAFEADPLSGYVTVVLSFALATVKRFAEAVSQARAAVQHDPESFLAKWEMGLAYHWNAQFEDAIAVLEPLWTETGHNWVAIGLIPTYAKTGRREQARKIYDSLLARRDREYVPPFVLAVGASALEDHEGAIGFCEAAIEVRDMVFALFHSWLPDFERVRSDSRFPDILARFNARGRTSQRD